MSILIDYDPTAVSPRPTGLVRAIVSNITDMGNKPDPFHEGKMKHQVAITWQLEHTWTDIKTKKQIPLQQTELYNCTLHEKGKLRPIIEGIIGKSLGPSGAKLSFDIETLIGKSCVLNIGPQPDNDKFTEVKAAAPLMPGMQPLTMVQMPVAQWILDLRDGKTKPKETSTDITNLDAIVAAL